MYHVTYIYLILSEQNWKWQPAHIHFKLIIYSQNTCMYKEYIVKWTHILWQITYTAHSNLIEWCHTILSTQINLLFSAWWYFCCPSSIMVSYMLDNAFYSSHKMSDIPQVCWSNKQYEANPTATFDTNANNIHELSWRTFNIRAIFKRMYSLVHYMRHRCKGRDDLGVHHWNLNNIFLHCRWCRLYCIISRTCCLIDLTNNLD